MMTSFQYNYFVIACCLVDCCMSCGAIIVIWSWRLTTCGIGKEEDDVLIFWELDPSQNRPCGLSALDKNMIMRKGSLN